MDKREQYQQIIMDVIKKYSNIKTSKVGIRMQTVFDKENDHYLLQIVGWEKDTRMYGIFVQFDIIDGKVWLQYDGTDVEFASELVEMGIPKEDIVLGFHHPSKWKHIGFGVVEEYVSLIESTYRDRNKMKVLG